MGGRKPVDLSGQRFGRLVVCDIAERGGAGVAVKWRCLCDCGNTAVIASNNIKKGQQSCGCFARDESSRRATTHSRSKSPVYITWRAMINRCTNPNSDGFPQYGGRGIKVCDRWAKFENFLADMGDRPGGCTIDRIDVNGDYTPNNCRWAVADTQNNNRRNTLHLTHNGVTKPLQHWAREIGMAPRTLRSRIFVQGWSVDSAITKPI